MRSGTKTQTLRSLPYYYIITVTYPLLHTYCYILTVTYLLLHTYCHIPTATYLLLHTFCMSGRVSQWRHHTDCLCTRIHLPVFHRLPLLPMCTAPPEMSANVEFRIRTDFDPKFADIA